jgi:hypothetical protein
MGIFPYEIVLRDILYKKKYGPKTTIIYFSGVIDPAEIVSVGSMTPLILFQRCQWPRWNSNIVDFFGEY